MKEKLVVGKPLFGNIFGETKVLKVLDFLFMGKDFDFTLTQIHNGTGLSRTAIRNALEELLKIKIIEKSREDEKSKYYRINKNNEKFNLLNLLYMKLTNEIINS